ncbi:fatty acid synthase [Trichonephila inaurata madagascariensis]|uniref:Fatty acid synthase n=1 Tax=Trichonephila inaurata madagascariensis TaxID=2747483 RepID=A0A8X6XMW4_9ARAC|nr:fatty acid synthase [Trichonephila inaurata madagascariensis]
MKYSEDLLRVETRIASRKDLETFRFPILLPHNPQMVEKLIMSKHLQLEHAGTQTLMSCLRESFWIIKSRKTVLGVIRRCTKRGRFSARPLEAVSIPLPEDRVRDSAVFEVTGIDLCGPLFLKTDKNAEYPPAAPWWGSFWVRLIGLLKSILRKVLGRACLSEELVTVLCDAESLINSRPLTYLSEDPDELSAFAPSMFLQEIRETEVRQVLRNRFRNEYLGILKDYSKVKGESSIKEGDLVLISEANNKRINWPLGKVTKMYKGKDGRVRVMEVKTKFGSVMRPIQKLYLLRKVHKLCFIWTLFSSIRSSPPLIRGIHVPSVPMFQQIISDALEEANVDHNEIEYVEAHGAGTQAGDQSEANALGQIFCKNRKKPLLIGTIKGNIGDTEASSAICGIIKSLIAFETNLIPPNIKYETPNLTAPDLTEGRLKVVTEPTTLNSDYIPVNSVGFGGTLVETILKRNPVTKESRERTKVNIARLVLYPATTEEGVNFVFEYIQNNPDLPDEFFALLHKLSFCAPIHKPYRGYALCQEGKSPVIEIKIALVDLLKHLDVNPDGMVGHSIGELLCAYVDGCLTHEQTLLSSYYRGQSVQNANIPQGGMAAVGPKICPEGIYPACDNATDSVTISGEKEPLEQFVEKLKQDNIFVRLVNSHGYGFHCKHVYAAAPALRKALEKEPWPFFRPHGKKRKTIDFLMESLGKLYNEGVDPKIERLYPPVQFPVPRGIPTISDLIKWNHSQSYNVPKYTAETSEFSMEFKFDQNDAYILDHKIDGRSLFPATGYIYLAWKVLATKLRKNFQEMPVVIENFKIHRATVITAQALTKFFVNLLDSSGRFEIKEDRSIVASGKVYEGKKLTFQQSPPEYSSSDLSVSASDIYDELKRSGYEYGPCFQGLVESNMDGTAGLVQWKGQWIPFLDALLLFFGIIANEEGFYLPTGALSFKIDPNVLINAVQSRDPSAIEEGNNCSQNLPVKFNQDTNTCRTVGVEITKLIVEPAPNRRKDENPTFEKYAFVPYESIYTPTSEASLQLSKYFNACNIFIDKIGKTVRNDVKQYQFPDAIDDEFCLEEYVEKTTENQHLLIVLMQAMDDENILKEKRKDWFLSYSRFAGRDMLNNSLLNEDSLRIMLEIISENTFRKLNVMEIHRNFPVSLIPATEIMQKYSHLRFKKSILVASKMDTFNQKALDELGIQVKTEESLTDIASEKAQDVAISSFACGSISELENLLQTLISVIKSDGFILLFYKEKANSAELFLSSLCGETLQVQSQGVLEEILKAKNLVILSKISDPFGSSLYLLRSPSPIVPSKVVFITEDSYNWVDKVKDELFEKKSGIVWLVSKDSPSNGIVGMVNCLKQEPGGERISICIVTGNALDRTSPKVPRPVEYSYVNCRKYGDLSSFEWIESNVKYVQQKNKKLIHIYNSALNFRDVMLATGKLSIDTAKHLGQNAYGTEFSGREDSTGKRVCGFAPARAMATSILADPEYCFDVPDNWTLEEAATVPIVYATCYYALIMRGKLQKGESILIHSGTGGIGIAAITIALSMNCEILLQLVSNDEKRKYLKQKFPEIKDENIGCSRNISFESMIMEEPMEKRDKAMHTRRQKTSRYSQEATGSCSAPAPT